MYAIIKKGEQKERMRYSLTVPYLFLICICYDARPVLATLTLGLAGDDCVPAVLLGITKLCSTKPADVNLV